ncbi:hypothetical protein BaRGS_00000065 [Batillaria attramentaria]|uniref:Uncharacterized protein n=1 Tax=Batillaria attramentaria TaxID=370345 RepID=A0ABD0M9J1_9CAEN
MFSTAVVTEAKEQKRERAIKAEWERLRETGLIKRDNLHTQRSKTPHKMTEPSSKTAISIVSITGKPFSPPSSPYPHQPVAREAGLDEIKGRETKGDQYALFFYWLKAARLPQLFLFAPASIAQCSPLG